MLWTLGDLVGIKTSGKSPARGCITSRLLRAILGPPRRCNVVYPISSLGRLLWTAALLPHTGYKCQTTGLAHCFLNTTSPGPPHPLIVLSLYKLTFPASARPQSRYTTINHPRESIRNPGGTERQSTKWSRRKMSTTISALPPSHTLNQCQSPMEQWDSEELIKVYLKNCVDPKMETDPELMRGRLQMFRVRMIELEKMRAYILPAVSFDFDRELAAVMYKRKLLLWMAFPIRKLPNEILTIIFRYVVWSSTSADQATQHRLWLTWVCKRFREVAIADSTLWNSVWFRDPPPWTRSLIFLERAGTAPLDIRINEKERPEGTPDDVPPPQPPITVAQINLILDKIIPRISQLRIIVIVLENLEVIDTIVRRFSTAGPPEMLERFEIHRTGPPYLWPPSNSSGSGGYHSLSRFPTPKLRWLSLNGLAVDWTTFQPANLRTIDLRRMCVQACPTSISWSRMLAASPDLFKLTLEAATPQLAGERLGSVRAIELPSLRDLTIGDMSCLYTLNVLAHMSAPRVMSLALVTLIGQDYGPLLEMLTGRFREVRVLQVQNIELNKTDLNLRRCARWFESMPRLKLLKFSTTRPHMLDALLMDPREYRLVNEMDVQVQSADGEETRPVICPELDTFYFTSQPGKEVAALVKGRKDIGAPAKRVYTTTGNVPHIPQKELADIRENAGQVCVIHNLHITEEEDIIHEEMANSLGLCVRWRRYKR
ncbi:hypothetical protein BC628DRAFT_873716 [Trametes gibbosa]|nr:hypothetical protein BC628DRAFT_873716 [Trametes gibbosa]